MHSDNEKWERLLRYHAWNNEPTVYECARRAFRDLSRTLCYSINMTDLNNQKITSKQLANDYEKCKKVFIRKVCHYITICIKNLDNDRDFNVWHKNTCEKIVKIAKDFIYDEHGSKLFARTGKTNNNEILTFFPGQAQKWLNVTLKSMWIIDQKNFDSNLISKLHIPVDDYIIEAATTKSKNIKTRLTKPYDKHPVKGKEKKSWSRWEYNEYMSFQKHIIRNFKNNYHDKEFESPIEWEDEAWAEIAKNRKAGD